MEFLLIRHTQCEVQAGICYGRLDLALRSTAEEDIARTLTSVPTVDAIFTSPSQRCALLARQLAQRDRCTLTTLDDLRELDFGDWEGVHWDDIPRELSDRWADDPWNGAPPGGESEAQLFARVERAFRFIAARGSTRIAVVAHAGPLRLLRCMALRKPLSERWAWTIAPGGVHSVSVA